MMTFFSEMGLPFDHAKYVITFRIQGTVKEENIETCLNISEKKMGLGCAMFHGGLLNPGELNESKLC